MDRPSNWPISSWTKMQTVEVDCKLVFAVPPYCLCENSNRTQQFVLFIFYSLFFCVYIQPQRPIFCFAFAIGLATIWFSVFLKYCITVTPFPMFAIPYLLSLLAYIGQWNYYEWIRDYTWLFGGNDVYIRSYHVCIHNSYESSIFCRQTSVQRTDSTFINT